MSKIFRNALCISPFVFEDIDKRGYSYRVNDTTATSILELQKIFINAGSTEMYTRIATKRYDDPENSDQHMRVHNLEVTLRYCRLAKDLNIPINPEIMCAYNYMDMFSQQAPDFSEYLEVYALQKGKPWQELDLQTMCTVLEKYGEFVSGEIKKTDCTVDHFNIGNEANFGFAGVSAGLKTAVNKKLENKKSLVKMYIKSMLFPRWFIKNIWKPNTFLMLALIKGLKKNFPHAKFSTHIAMITAKSAVLHFKTLIKYRLGCNVNVQIR